MKLPSDRTNKLLDLIDESSVENLQNKDSGTDNIHFGKPDLKRKESILIVDLVKREIVFCKGFNDLLGYKDSEITLELLDENRHPDDTEIVNRVGVATILYTYENPNNNSNYSLLVSYRRQKKDGAYIKILSKSSAYKVDNKGRIIKLLIQFTDISFLDQTYIVKWNFDIDNLDKESFKQNIYKAYKGFFTEREMEIIIELNKGSKSKKIANKLNVSKHTIATHRKNILKKANVHTLDDLISFCNKNGLI